MDINHNDIDEQLRQLVDRRNRAAHEAKALVEEVRERGDDFTAEEREKFDRLVTDVDAMKADEKRLLDAHRVEREAAEARQEYERVISPAAIDAVDRQATDDVLAFFRGQGPRARDFDLTRVAAEKAALRAGARGKEFRDLTVGTAAAGGNTVPTDFVRRLYDYLERYTGMRRANVTVLTTTGGGNLEVPKVVTGGTAAIVGEGTALAEVDATFGKVTLGSWKYGQLSQVSNELLSDTGVDLVGFLARDFGRSIGRATNAHYTTGTGTNQPLGVFTAMGTALTGANSVGGSATYANLITLRHSVNEEYRMNGAEWMTADASVGALMNIVDSNGRPILNIAANVGEPDTMLGYPIVTNPGVAALGTGAKWLAFGDFSAYYIRDVGQVRVERSDEFAFSSDLVTWRGILRTDGDLIDLTGAVKAFRGGTA